MLEETEVEIPTLTELTIENQPPTLAELRTRHDRAQAGYEALSVEYKAAKDRLDQLLDAQKRDWEIAHESLIADYTKARERADQAAAALRRAVVLAWTERGDVVNKVVDKELKLSVKAPPLVLVREGQGAAALAWAKDRLPIAVQESLNRKFFDAAILQLPEEERPACVEIAREPVAVIGK